MLTGRKGIYLVSADSPAYRAILHIIGATGRSVKWKAVASLRVEAPMSAK